jgi:hypothetical protein
MKCRIPGWAAIALTRAPFLLVLALFIADSADTTQQTAAQDAGAVSLHDSDTRRQSVLRRVSLSCGLTQARANTPSWAMMDSLTLGKTRANG